MNNFYSEIVDNLKKEVKALNDRLAHYRRQGDMYNYISTLKSLKNTLDLIATYDWQLKYSEYTIKSDFKLLEDILNKYNISLIDENFKYKFTSAVFSEIATAWDLISLDDKVAIAKLITGRDYFNREITQIAVWEQNHTNEIRNYKTWTVLPKDE